MTARCVVFCLVFTLTPSVASAADQYPPSETRLAISAVPVPVVVAPRYAG